MSVRLRSMVLCGVAAVALSAVLGTGSASATALPGPLGGLTGGVAHVPSSSRPAPADDGDVENRGTYDDAWFGNQGTGPEWGNNQGTGPEWG